MISKLPVKVGFDPTASQSAAKLWALPAGRILMLLWRPCHICSTSWYAGSLPVAERIHKTRPTTSDQLFECFLPAIKGCADYTSGDCRSFCAEAIDYFTGAHSVPYVGVVEGIASMEESNKQPKPTAAGASP